ncbi:MAG: tetratricopeptide repeat protein [Muribaculaceae bacterium]|nr:tetratricopeptide repeat protein [Muribaculaceae bacterium]
MQTSNKELRQFMVRAIGTLNHYEVSTAIDIIRKYLDTHTDATLKDMLERTAYTYQYMLHYMMEGQEDPARPKLYSDLREDLYGIIRAIEYRDNLKDNPELYYSTARISHNTGTKLSELMQRYDTLHDILLLTPSETEKQKIYKERDSILCDIFDNIWTIPPGNRTDIAEVMEFAEAKKEDVLLASIIIGALTMGALKIYDRQKLLALLDLDNIVNERLSARTLTGIVLILYRHANRLKDDYTLRMRFDTWTDNLMNYRRLRELLMVLIRTVGSMQAVDKIQEEIMPDIMKAGPDLLNKFKSDQGELNLMDIEENPEWEELISKSGLKDKISRLERMQRDGADLMLMGLGRMKQMPFFNKIANWFLPFTTDHSAINGSLNDSEMSFVSTIDKLNMMCDSDKYSFALMISQLPKAQLQQMSEGLQAQLEQHNEEYKEAMLKSSTPDFDRESMSYIRSLYRFYNFYRMKREFPSPFGFPFNFNSLPYLGSLLSEREIVEMVAEFYFRNRHYKEALQLFLIIAEQANEGALYEKIGYCYLQEKDSAQALKYFEKAELFNINSQWLCRNIAKAAELSGQYDKATHYYTLLLEDDQDNIKLLLSEIRCLIKTGNYTDALKALYKIDYIDPENDESKQLAAKCRMYIGQFDRANEIIENIIATRLLSGEKPDSELLLLSGHTKIAQGKIKEGISRYSEAMRSPHSTISDLNELRNRLEHDWVQFPSEAFDRSIIPLISDAVNLALN